MTRARSNDAIGGSPCEGCGLCCNGVLYSRARVEPGEEERIEGAGLDLLDISEKTYFRLPCRLEQDGLCTIYENRFTICRTFRCALLRRFDSGEIGLAEARSKVSEAKRLLEAVAASDPEAVFADNRQRSRAALSEKMQVSDDQSKHNLGERLVNLVALDTFLDRFFRNRKHQSPVEAVIADPENIG